MRIVKGTEVFGVGLDDASRCARYATDADVLALRFACCDRFYCCRECHDALADHETELWPRIRFEEAALLCGRCGLRFSVDAYLADAEKCPGCGGAFNPGCRSHHHLYFEAATEVSAAW